MSLKRQFPLELTDSGEFERQEDVFREWVSADGSTRYPAVPDRYHLYVSHACPWSQRTVISRKLMGLEKAIGLTVLDPVRDDRGWAFREGPGHSGDPVNGFQFLSEAYQATDPDFTGRHTVPALWDKESGRIVNNSEDDICRMFNDAFRGLAESPVDLFPREIADQQAELGRFIYEFISNGVYRAGFATTQAAYERAARALFLALDRIDARLKEQRYLFGDRIVETDWGLFCTLLRFDAVYYSHFKCNLRRIVDYAHLDDYLCDLYQQPGAADTVNLDHIKRHYYLSHDEINPTRIVPIGPELNLDRPHRRDRIGKPTPVLTERPDLDRL